MKRLTKRVLSVILSILMVITVVPASVFSAVAEDTATEQSVTATEGPIQSELSLAAGESYEYTVGLTEVDKTKNLVLAFVAHQSETASGAELDNAILSINGNRTLRVTGGNGMHIWDEVNDTAVSGSVQWNGYTSEQFVVVTVDFTSEIVNFLYNGVNVNLTSLDLSVDKLTFKFGGSNTPALTIKNIAVACEFYENDFSSADDVASGTIGDTSKVAFSASDDAMKLTHVGFDYLNSYWETSVDLNGTDGMIILKTTIDADASQTAQTQDNSGKRGTGAVLTVNGKVVIQNSVKLDNSNAYTVTLGGKTEISHALKSGCKEEVILVINPKTGIASMFLDQSAASAKYNNSGTYYFPRTAVVEEIDLGPIGETISVRYGSNRHGDYFVYNLSAYQWNGDNLESTKPSTLLEVGRIAYAGWKNGTKNEYTVETNKTNGDITIVFTPERNNWYSDGNNLLSVNGVSLIKTYGVSESYNGYYLGTTAVKTGAANVITVVITPSTGVATISDAAGNTGTANVGIISDSFKLVVNQDYNNSWELTSIVVTQVVGEGSDTPVSNTLYTNSFDSADDIARGTCGNENTAYDENKSALRISYVGEYDYSNAYWEESIELNGTDGLITLKTSIDADSNNHPAAVGATGAILTVNGKVVIQNKQGGRIVTLGDGTEIKGCAGGYIEEITLVINPENGRATLTFDQTAANAKDGSYPKTTVIENIVLGVVGETLSVSYGTNRHTHFYVYSLSVDQENGGELETHTCEYTTTVKEATCTTPEFTKKACLECGLFTETVTAPVLGHTWGAWTKSNGVATRSCTVCEASQSKSVGAVDNSKSLLAIGDSLTYGLNVENTVNGAWAKYVSDNLGIATYQNYAVHGTEVYQWYSLLTGNAAPNGGSTNDIAGLTKDGLVEAIKNAGVVAFSLGSNDLIGGYVGHRSAEKVHETLIKIVDEIHSINPDAIVVSVGYAYGVSMVVGGKYENSYQLFIDFNDLMIETLNSEAYNSFAYYVDVSNVMSNVALMGADKVHPTAEGQKKIADRVNAALESLDKTDKVTWEYVPSYANHFDGTVPAAAVVSWGATGTGGVLTVAPSTDKNGNQLSVGSVAFPGKTVVTFKFNIPQLPESGTVNIFHDRGAWQSYVCVFSKVNEETQETEFFASVGNNNEGNSVVKIEGNTWYDVTILFAEDADSYSRVYIGNTFIGTVKGTIVGRTAGWGFANFSGCSGAGVANAATYQIDDFTASTVADEALVHAYGIQRSAAYDLLHDVRFVLSVKDIFTAESAIGLDISVDYGDGTGSNTDLITDIVFESIIEELGDKNNTINASDLGGKYIAAFAVREIPVEYECVEFVVSPYAVIDGVKYYSKAMTVTVYSKK